jgi:hypothetical protein
VTSHPEHPEYPGEPERAYEYPSLEETPPAWSQPYPPAGSASPYVPPENVTPAVPPPAFPPPYHGGVPYNPYSPPRSTNGQAIGAFVASIVGVFLCFCGVPAIVGLVLGIVAMNETKRTGQDGYGLAVAAVVIGAIAVALFAGFWLFAALNPDGASYYYGF